ncbi:hypothetical protein [Hutsoniella sourekii]|uniref:hypothetical protein n=1 Tax=Hutsoniella sourekii TaxID=87650 RepID=UPI0004835928|nr:hypothetical protein [Hutsoniella sourekii]
MRNYFRKSMDNHEESFDDSMDMEEFDQDIDFNKDYLREIQDDQESQYSQPLKRRSRYHAGMDRFLNNGIIIVGILLLIVLLIAFLV